MSACVAPPLAALPRPSPGSRRPPPSRCLHDQRRKLQHGRSQAAGRWALTAGTPDPASGTLLPLLFPPAWTSSWKKPCGRTAMRTLEAACHPVERGTNHRRSHSSAAAAALPTPDEHEASPPPTASSISHTASSASVSSSDFWRPRRPALSKKELLSFVDLPAEGDTVDEHMEFIRDPYMRRYAQADEPEVVVSHKREEDEYPTWHDVAKADKDVQRLIHELNAAVGSRLRNPNRASAASIYHIYNQLPGVRMAHVPATLRHQLLKALGMVEKKDAQSMLRYFAVIADVKDGGFNLWMAEWNAAISFAARYVGSSSATEVEAAMNLWREMEQEASVQGNSVTFNILFDVASKAGNFTLAEMVYQEMEKRGFTYNRYHHVSLIHFFGLKMDADGIRAAYQEMVNAGEMIDVVVLNCVMAGFLRCGEEDAAERVYERMQQTYMARLRGAPKKTPQTETNAPTETDADAATPPSVPEAGSPPTGPLVLDAPLAPASLDTSNFASQKVMTNILMMLAKVSKGDSTLRAGFQHLVPTRPDLATYRILINHYAIRLGDLSTVTRYLSDMKKLRIPLHGAVFLALFKGFAMHGGRTGTGADWSEQRLRSIWTALLKALDDEVEGLYISTWLVMWALRAFDRCSTPEMVFKAYNSLFSRWDPTEAEADFTIGVLHDLLKGRPPRSAYRKKSDTGHSESPAAGYGTKGWHATGGKTSVMNRLGSPSFG